MSISHFATLIALLSYVPMLCLQVGAANSCNNLANLHLPNKNILSLGLK